MKEQLISFETAKLAKQKGFDEVTELNYISKGNPLWEPKSIKENFNNLKHSDGKNYFYSAPTQSLLQKWLREEHGIDLYLDSIGGGRYYYGIYLNDNNDTHILQEGEGIYEEVLEIGLQEALKLI